MNIGQAAKKSGVNAKLIRYYESIGIVPKATRTQAGYRIYTDTDVHILGFVNRARGFGFPLKEIKKLVSLWRNKTRENSEVKLLALAHIKKLEIKMAELEEMANTLRDLARHCRGDHRPDCPILDSLAER